jgi:hypothetical protein
MHAADFKAFNIENDLVQIYSMCQVGFIPDYCDDIFRQGELFSNHASDE